MVIEVAKDGVEEVGLLLKEALRRMKRNEATEVDEITVDVILSGRGDRNVLVISYKNRLE